MVMMYLRVHVAKPTFWQVFLQICLRGDRYTSLAEDEIGIGIV